MKRIKEAINRQYGKPRGLLGMYIGEKMIRQHKPETLWTMELLQLSRSEKVLELGCGAGYAMKLILDQTLAEQAVGLDLSAALIRSAALRNKNALTGGRAELVQANVNRLPFQEDHFEKVFSIHSVYFWDDLSKTLSEIHRVLKPGGYFVLTLSDGKGNEEWGEIKNLIEERLIPAAKRAGFLNVTSLRGPDSRQYHTVAILGHKES